MRDRLAWIDWMKCLGMLLIVLGHSGAQNYLDPAAPINFKQFGVTFFVFVMGFSLAGEQQSSLKVLYNRLFEVYLFGGLFAVVLSASAWLRTGDLLESNYLPLLGGINVFFNYFPANPTTWYIGTYLHLLLLWALLLRGRTIRLWMLAVWLCCEVAVRAFLMQLAGDFTAYMMLTNWVGVYLLGLWTGQQPVPVETGRERALTLVVCGGLLLCLVVLWPWLLQWSLPLSDGFPFRRLELGGLWATLLGTSSAVSLLYLAYTWLTFQVTRRLPNLLIVNFLARNTLIVFIVHMPMIYAWNATVASWIPGGGLRTLANIALYYVLPAIGSNLLRSLLLPQTMRRWIWDRFAGKSDQSPPRPETPLV